MSETISLNQFARDRGVNPGVVHRKAKELAIDTSAGLTPEAALSLNEFFPLPEPEPPIDTPPTTSGAIAVFSEVHAGRMATMNQSQAARLVTLGQQFQYVQNVRQLLDQQQAEHDEMAIAEEALQRVQAEVEADAAAIAQAEREQKIEAMAEQFRQALRSPLGKSA
jgi:hypothetical protein